MKKEEQKPVKLPVVKRSVRHTFTPEEIQALYVDFRQSFGNVAAAEAEFESVKAQHKAKIAEAEARMSTLDAMLQAGFEMRLKDCVVVFRPADKKKDLFIVIERHHSGLLVTDVEAILTEDMTQEDFEQDLVRAESAFDSRSEIVLWDAADDSGKVVVGKFGKRWYSAVRGNIGGQRLDERMDSEQKGVKEREDAVGAAGKRAMEWLEATLGKESAQGFAPGIVAALEGERGKVE